MTSSNSKPVSEPGTVNRVFFSVAEVEGRSIPQDRACRYDGLYSEVCASIFAGRGSDVLEVVSGMDADNLDADNRKEGRRK
jgi:hypothetical protein